MSGERLNSQDVTVLLIEDEEKLAITLSDFLRRNGYRTEYELTGYSGLEYFYDHMHEISLILLDVMLPDISGEEILKEIRQKSRVPVIIITARDTVRDQLRIFEKGADDYIVKPYVLSIVKAHVDAVLKRSGVLETELVFEEICVKVEARQAYCAGRLMELTPREYEMLEYFVRYPNKVHSREVLLETLWGYHYNGDSRTVDTIVKQLRKKLGSYGQYIRSVYGIGYGLDVNKEET